MSHSKAARVWAKEKIIAALRGEFAEYKRILPHYTACGTLPPRGYTVRSLVMELDQYTVKPIEWVSLYGKAALVRGVLKTLHRRGDVFELQGMGLKNKKAVHYAWKGESAG